MKKAMSNLMWNRVSRRRGVWNPPVPVENPIEQMREREMYDQRRRAELIAQLEMERENILQQRIRGQWTRDNIFQTTYPNMYQISIDPVITAIDPHPIMTTGNGIIGEIDRINKEREEPAMEFELKVDVTNRNSSYGDSRIFRWKNNEDTIASLVQVPFPNCCGVCIFKDFSFDSNISQDQFNNFISSITSLLMKDDFYKKAIMYAWTLDGSHERLFSNVNGIEILEKFRNPRSGHIVSEFAIQILK